MATKDEAVENAKVAEKQVEKTVENLEKSKFAKKIPLEVSKVSLKDLICISFILKLSYLIPAYLIISLAAEPQLRIGQWIIQFFKTIYVFVAIFDLIFEAVVGVGAISSFHGLACISAIAKNTVVNVMLVAYVAVEMRTMLFLAYALFAAVTIIVDMFLLYYLKIYFDQLAKETTEEDEKV